MLELTEGDESMYELMKNRLQTKMNFAIFALLLITYSILYTNIKLAKKISKKRTRNAVRIGVSSFLVFAWLYLFVYLLVYPIALANYEYNNDLTESDAGTVDTVYIKNRFVVEVTIDGVKYNMAHSSVDPVFKIGRDFDEGNIVKVVYGKNSRYIFDIYKLKFSPSDKRLFGLASKIYNESQLQEIASFNGYIDELDYKYPIYCLRKHNGIYRVSYLGEESIAVLLFDDACKKFSGKIFTPTILKSAFSGIEKGCSLEEVRKIDPDGEYLFIDTAKKDTPKVSSHYTIDGYLITVEYDDENTVINVDVKVL